MSSSVDLRGLLQGWPYDPEDDTRTARGDDGREILQVRLPLGLEQYELNGRPDGVRPHGMDSLLDFHLKRLAEAKASEQDAAFTLTHEECAGLFAEGTLYYYRYLHLFQIKDWLRTVRDTSRNLRMFDFVHRYAESEPDQMYQEQWRPYLMRMNSAASAMLELENGNHDKALEIIQTTISNIHSLPEMEDETFKIERRRSLAALRELAGQIQKTKPVSELERLEQDLRGAIETQQFERAAELRDRIRALRKREQSK
ncbi:MAG: UvrB/UvrC motif-containing protein [Verrucomicrobia bacterium]|nr:UvrB/UvrC motif-containing protein [Verrucomicrobiota bacterium]